MVMKCVRVVSFANIEATAVNNDHKLVCVTHIYYKRDECKRSSIKPTGGWRIVEVIFVIKGTEVE